jgi:translation initiation factor IF-2
MSRQSPSDERLGWQVCENGVSWDGSDGLWVERSSECWRRGFVWIGERREEGSCESTAESGGGATLVDMEAINSQRIQERKKEAEDGAAEDEADESKPESGPKELRLVIKGDVSGSVEALVGALQGIGNKDATVKIVSTGVGDVSEGDVMMAKAAEGESCDIAAVTCFAYGCWAGMVVAFSVNTPRAVEGAAASNNIPLYSSTIIYRVMEEIRSRVIALLPPVIEHKVTGEANVLQLFDIHIKSRQTQQVAGCRVINGLVEKSRNGRVVRDGITIHEGRFIYPYKSFLEYC